LVPKFHFILYTSHAAQPIATLNISP
jgi:hypothetical protein